MMSVLFLLVGLGLILSGANFLTNGAAALAKRFNISSLVIGSNYRGLWNFGSRVDS